MTERFKPKIGTILILIIGALLMLIASYGCAIDWTTKLESGRDWTGNLFYHPLTGVISIIFFTIFAFFLLERISPGKLEKMNKYIDEKNQIEILLLAIIIGSFIILIIDSIMLLAMYPTNFDILIIIHIITAILIGFCLSILILRAIIHKIINNPNKYQNYIIIGVVIIIIIFLLWLIISISMGRISSR